MYLLVCSFISIILFEKTFAPRPSIVWLLVRSFARPPRSLQNTKSERKSDRDNNQEKLVHSEKKDNIKIYIKTDKFPSYYYYYH